jgi:hypothetical protein
MSTATAWRANADRERADPAQDLKEEHVVAEDIGVQGAHASLRSPGEE